MRQDSETNIIVLNTAAKYKIQKNTQKKTQIYKIQTHTKRASVEPMEINRATKLPVFAIVM